MAWWLTLLLWAGSFVLNRVLAPRLRLPRQENAKALTLSDFETITASEGRAIPVLFGTRLVRGANIGWYGDLSTVAIVQSGVTTGYKYYLGIQYLLCMGPVDEIIELRFNERPVGLGITAANNQIVFAKSGGAPWKTAVIPPENYGSVALAAAIRAAMIAAESGDWKVGFGFTIVAGVNDKLRFKVVGDVPNSGVVVTASLTPGVYTGATLATHVQARLTAAETPMRAAFWRTTFAVSYSGGTFKFTITPGLQQVTSEFTLLKDGEDNGKFLLGYRHHQDQLAVFSQSLVGDFAVKASRFIFSYGGTTAALRCTDAAFTSATVLGFSTAADKTGLGIAITDSDFSPIEATFTQTTDYLQIDINDPDFFGTEGGLSGRLDTYLGKTTQAASSYLTTKFGSQAPAYRSLVYAVAHGMYVGNTNYPKPPSWVLRRVPNSLGLTDGAEDIGGDANPASIIYECLTDTIWGLGMAAGQINAASFLDAGATLKAEGLGLSLLLENAAEGEAFIEEVLRHIDAILFSDPITGLVTLKLVRGDYDVDTVPAINRDNARSVKLTRGSWDETRNVVKIRYIDRAANYTERVAQAMDAANIQARAGEQAVQELSFPGISSARNAQIAADRAIRVLSALLAQLEITMNRENWNLRPGSVFRLDWPDEGIVGMPCRATRVRHGEIDSNEIVVDAVQDVTGEAWPTGSSLLTGWGVVYGYDYGGMV